MWFRRQVLCKMWPIQLASLCDIFCRLFLSPLTPCNTSVSVMYACINKQLTNVWNCFIIVLARPRKGLKKFFSYQVSEHSAVLCTIRGLWAIGSAGLVYGVTVSCVCTCEYLLSFGSETFVVLSAVWICTDNNKPVYSIWLWNISVDGGH